MRNHQKTALTAVMLASCALAVSGITLFLKARFDQLVDSAVEARLKNYSSAEKVVVPEIGNQIESVNRRAGSPSSDQVATIRSVVESEMAECTPEEREVWIEELKFCSPREAREILSLRHSLPESRITELEANVQITSSEEKAPRVLPPASVENANPIPNALAAKLTDAIEGLQTELQQVRAELAALQQKYQELQNRTQKFDDSPNGDHG